MITHQGDNYQILIFFKHLTNWRDSTNYFFKFLMPHFSLMEGMACFTDVVDITSNFVKYDIGMMLSMILESCIGLLK